MSKVARLFVILMPLAGAACSTVASVGGGMIPGGGESALPAGPPFDVATGFGSGDYLLSDYNSDDYTYRTLFMAKMVTPAAKSTGEAEFQKYKDVSKSWTPNYWKVRPATAADIAVDRKIVFFHGQWDDSQVYILPRTLKEGREETWHGGTITDLSLLAGRGVILLKDKEGEDFKVRKENAFVVVGK